MKYLWDTNIVIYYLQQHFPPNAEKFIDEAIKFGGPSISAITEIELLCWNAPSSKDYELLLSFIENALVFELEREIKLVTAEIRKSAKIKLPDAIIAATAINHNLTLLSRNVQDFKKVEGLKLANPYHK